MKNCQVGETSRKNCRVVLRHGMSCERVRWKILWIGEKEDRTFVQSLNSLLGRPSLHDGGTGISWRTFKNMLTDCLEILVSGTIWYNWHSLVSKQTCTSCHKMDKSSWQTLSSNDHRQYCHVGNTAQHCRMGLFQDSDFAVNFEDSESTSGGNLLCLRKSNIRSTNAQFTQGEYSVVYFSR